MRASDDLATGGYPHVRMRAVLVANWWAVALRGAFAILFGLLALFVPGVTIGVLVLLYAAYMLADGALAIVAAARGASHHERWGLLLLEGVVDIVAGLVAFVWPAITVLVFVYLLAVWTVVTGALLLDAAHGRWWMMLGGILSIVWGVMLFVAPAAGTVVLTWWLGAYSLLFGILLLVLGFSLRSRRHVVST